MLKKSKEELAYLIENEHDLNALTEYLNDYQTQKEDIEYLLSAFYNIARYYMYTEEKQILKFHQEYIRLYTVAIRKNIIEANREYLKKIENIISTTFKINPNSLATYLYSARFYKMMYQNHVEPYTNKYDTILLYYTKAEELGSKQAKTEKTQFLEKEQAAKQQSLEKEKSAALILDYYNADYDLNDLINQILLNKQYQNFSLLLHGPENAGMSEFANKLFALINKSYKNINAGDLNSRQDFGRKITSSLEDHNALILKNIDTCLNKYDRFEDKKDFTLQSNTEFLINKIRENENSFILIVNDITQLPQALLDVFPLKVRFDYMNKLQKRTALQNILGLSENTQLDDVNGLVYDDFLRVKEKLSFFGNFTDNDIIDMLKKEAFDKPSFLTYSFPVLSFDEKLINTDTDLLQLTSRLENITLPFTMLIYGPSGTGKSYYLRYLAHKMGKSVIEKTAAELFSKYQGEPAKNVLNLFREAEEQNAVIILDEVERITGNRDSGKNDSQWRSDMTNAFLTCLENTKCPFLATTNFISDIDKAILRRFIFKIKFDYLTPEQITYAFYHNFNQQPPEELLKIGGITNGDFAIVKKKAQILGVTDDARELCEMLKSEVSVKTTGHVEYFENSINYDRNFINIEGNALDLYVKKIKETKIHNFSILLYGPSGTGKSLYLRHLAQELGYKIIERRASDIMDKWFGETEKNIAAAFEEAKNHRAMLIFDEVDSLMPNKGNIRQPHEARIVNEFLVQLENHPYPVCATTNFLENMENASIRRFKINAKFDYLQKNQYGYVYRKTFGVEPIQNIENLTNLTPAIFARASEKIELEGVQTDPTRIFEIFLEEVKQCTGKDLKKEEDKTYEKLVIDKLPLYTAPITYNYDKILTGFVKIITDTGHGSGFFFTDDGFILTNKHVVKEQKIVTVELFSGRHVPGEVIRTNSLDVALIKISSENKIYPLPIRTTEVDIGASVFCLGNPGDKNQVLSKGCITRYTINKNAQRIETDCFMDRGASGGPLLDEYGNVIGINVEGWLVPNMNIKLGLNLHLSINDALRVLNIKIAEDA